MDKASAEQERLRTITPGRFPHMSELKLKVIAMATLLFKLEYV